MAMFVHSAVKLEKSETDKRLIRKAECTNFLNLVKQYQPNLPLYLYSFRVYLAYNNLWYYINRDLISEDEYDVMLKLGCYKYPRRYRGPQNIR